MSALHDRAQIDDKLDAGAVQSLQTKVDAMQAAILVPKEGVIDARYLQALDFDSQAVNRAVAEPDSGKSNAMIKDIMADLAVKVDFASATVAAQSRVPGVVHVTVTTSHNGAVVNGYLVQCNPKMWDNPATAQVSFPVPSSPTASDLVPGNWIFYAVKNGARVQSQPATIGQTAQADEAVTIVIP